MNKIKLNNLELEVESYNKNTYFNGATITSSANTSVRTNNMTALNELALTDITSIQIYANQELIYDLQNITAHIDNINEYLNGERMNVSLNLSFRSETSNEDNSEPIE